MRKHLTIAVVVGCIPIAAPAFLIGQAGWSDLTTIAACLGLIAPATLLSLIVFLRLEPNAGSQPHRQTSRLRT